MRTFSDTDRTTSPGSSNASSEYSLLSALDGLALSDRSSGSIETVESLESVESAASTAATLSDTSETSDDYELILIPSSGSSSTSVIPLSSSSGRRSSRRRTTDSDDDWQSVSDTSEGTERPSHTRTAPSTLSASDAQASIDRCVRFSQVLIKASSLMQRRSWATRLTSCASGSLSVSK